MSWVLLRTFIAWVVGTVVVSTLGYGLYDATDNLTLAMIVICVLALAMGAGIGWFVLVKGLDRESPGWWE